MFMAFGDGPLIENGGEPERIVVAHHPVRQPLPDHEFDDELREDAAPALGAARDAVERQQGFGLETAGDAAIQDLILKSLHVIIRHTLCIGDPVDEIAKLILHHPLDSRRLFFGLLPVTRLSGRNFHTDARAKRLTRHAESPLRLSLVERLWLRDSCHSGFARNHEHLPARTLWLCNPARSPFPHFTGRRWYISPCQATQIRVSPLRNTPMRHHGIHHVTAIAGPARRNLDFYTRALGLRLVKKTVNFDDPGTYHLYFGDEPRTARHDPDLLPLGARRTRTERHRPDPGNIVPRSGDVPRLLDAPLHRAGRRARQSGEALRADRPDLQGPARHEPRPRRHAECRERTRLDGRRHPGGACHSRL